MQNHDAWTHDHLNAEYEEAMRSSRMLGYVLLYALSCTVLLSGMMLWRVLS
jgi:hypothetical protein